MSENEERAREKAKEILFKAIMNSDGSKRAINEAVTSLAQALDDAKREGADSALLNAWNYAGKLLTPAEVLEEAKAAAKREGFEECQTFSRECFLNMIADADKWEVEVDGDVDGVTVTYRLEVDGFSFEQLPEALGIKVKYMETMEDAIAREVEKPARKLTPKGGA